MFPILLLGLVAAVAFGFSKGSPSSPAGPTIIPGPAGANVNMLPPGSMVMTHDSSEAITVVSQGPLGYFGITAVSGNRVTFLPTDITLVQRVGGPLPPISAPPLALPSANAAPPTVTSGRW